MTILNRSSILTTLCFACAASGAFVSDEVGGKKFIVSETKYRDNVHDLADMCRRRLGGNLVEIESRAEYDVFLNFLKTSVNDVTRDDILLGAHYKDGVWYYLSSHDEITFAEWTSSNDHPSHYGDARTCQWLVWNGNDEGMQFWECLGPEFTHPDHNTRLACQIRKPVRPALIADKYFVFVGTDVVFTCDHPDINDPDDQMVKYQFFKGDQPVTGKQSGNTYTQPGVSISDTGFYSCTVTVSDLTSDEGTPARLQVSEDRCLTRPCQHGGVCHSLPGLDTFSCDCSDTGYDGQTCEMKLPDAEYVEADQDTYYKNRSIGYYGIAQTVIIPACFLLILIFLLMDIISWFVRRALKERDRKRREMRRHRVVIDVDKEISNPFIVAMIKLIGYVFNKKVRQLVKEKQDKMKQDGENAETSTSDDELTDGTESDGETVIAEVPTHRRGESISSESTEASSAADSSGDDSSSSSVDTKDHATNETSSDITSSSSASSGQTASLELESEVLRNYLKEQKKSVSSNKTVSTMNTTKHTSKDDSSLKFRSRPVYQRDVDPRLASVSGNQSQQRNDTLMSYLKDQQEYVASLKYPNESEEKRRKRKPRSKM